jgi:hypothetical protein
MFKVQKSKSTVFDRNHVTNQIKTKPSDSFFLSSIMDNNVSIDSSWIPEGYVEIIGPNGQHYLVPRFYAPALNNTLVGFEEKKKLEIEKAAGTVSYFNYIN